MRSSLGRHSAALSNVFRCSFESKWHRNCSNCFKPVFYRSLIEIFATLSSPNHTDKFKESSKHPNLIFSIKKEKYGCLPFVNVNIFRENEKFTTSF